MYHRSNNIFKKRIILFSLLSLFLFTLIPLQQVHAYAAVQTYNFSGFTSGGGSNIVIFNPNCCKNVTYWSSAHSAITITHFLVAYITGSGASARLKTDVYNIANNIITGLNTTLIDSATINCVNACMALSFQFNSTHAISYWLNSGGSGSGSSSCITANYILFNVNTLASVTGTVSCSSGGIFVTGSLSAISNPIYVNGYVAFAVSTEQLGGFSPNEFAVINGIQNIVGSTLNSASIANIESLSITHSGNNYTVLAISSNGNYLTAEFNYNTQANRNFQNTNSFKPSATFSGQMGPISNPIGQCNPNVLCPSQVSGTSPIITNIGNQVTLGNGSLRSGVYQIQMGSTVSSNVMSVTTLFTNSRPNEAVKVIGNPTPDTWYYVNATTNQILKLVFNNPTNTFFEYDVTGSLGQAPQYPMYIYSPTTYAFINTGASTYTIYNSAISNPTSSTITTIIGTCAINCVTSTISLTNTGTPIFTTITNFITSTIPVNGTAPPGNPITTAISNQIATVFANMLVVYILAFIAIWFFYAIGLHHELGLVLIFDMVTLSIGIVSTLFGGFNFPIGIPVATTVISFALIIGIKGNSRNDPR